MGKERYIVYFCVTNKDENDDDSSDLNFKEYLLYHRIYGDFPIYISQKNKQTKLWNTCNYYADITNVKKISCLTVLSKIIQLRYGGDSDVIQSQNFIINHSTVWVNFTIMYSKNINAFNNFHVFF